MHGVAMQTLDKFRVHKTGNKSSVHKTGNKFGVHKTGLGEKKSMFTGRYDDAKNCFARSKLTKGEV